MAYHDGRVDLEVTTQDVWTFNPGLSLAGAAARPRGIELEELNFLGTGAQLGLGYKSDPDRQSTALFYRDPQLGSSWWDLSTRYSDNSDGRLAGFALLRPFDSLVRCTPGRRARTPATIVAWIRATISASGSIATRRAPGSRARTGGSPKGSSTAGRAAILSA